MADGGSAAASTGATRCILLWAAVSGNLSAEKNTRNLQTMLKAHKITFEMLDGSAEENKAERNRLFTVSGKRGVYPQLFIVRADGDTKFIGDFDTINEMNESETLSAALFEAPRDATQA